MVVAGVVSVLGVVIQDGGLIGTVTVSIQKLMAPQLGLQVVMRKKKNGDFPCDIFCLNHSMKCGSLFGFVFQLQLEIKLDYTGY